MQFVAYGYPNIRATHKTTIEFTKEKDLSLKGDCIVGVNADFDAKALREFIGQNKDKKVRIILCVDDIKEEICAELNPHFNDNKEMVIRKSGFISKRTFAIKADKAASDLDRELVKRIKNSNQRIRIILVIL